MEVGEVYYDLRTKCLFQCVHIEGYTVYLCNPSNDSDEAKVCMPVGSVPMLGIILGQDIGMTAEEYDQAVEKTLLWARSFRYYNRIFAGLLEDLNCVHVYTAYEAGYIRKCAIFKDVYESVAFLFNTESHKSFKEKNNLEYVIVMHQMSWLTQNKKLMKSIYSLSPEQRKEVPVKKRLARK